MLCSDIFDDILLWPRQQSLRRSRPSLPKIERDGSNRQEMRVRAQRPEMRYIHGQRFRRERERVREAEREKDRLKPIYLSRYLFE